MFNKVDFIEIFDPENFFFLLWISNLYFAALFKILVSLEDVIIWSNIFNFLTNKAVESKNFKFLFLNPVLFLRAGIIAIFLIIFYYYNLLIILDLRISSDVLKNVLPSSLKKLNFL